MRYLVLKWEALFNLLQHPFSSTERQEKEVDLVCRLNLADVIAQLLDTRRSTGQLDFAS